MKLRIEAAETQILTFALNLKSHTTTSQKSVSAYSPADCRHKDLRPVERRTNEKQLTNWKRKKNAYRSVLIIIEFFIFFIANDKITVGTNYSNE